MFRRVELLTNAFSTDMLVVLQTTFVSLQELWLAMMSVLPTAQVGIHWGRKLELATLVLPGGGRTWNWASNQCWWLVFGAQKGWQCAAANVPELSASTGLNVDTICSPNGLAQNMTMFCCPVCLPPACNTQIILWAGLPACAPQNLLTSLRLLQRQLPYGAWSPENAKSSGRLTVTGMRSTPSWSCETMRGFIKTFPLHSTCPLWIPLNGSV